MNEKDKNEMMDKIDTALCNVGVIAKAISEQAETSEDKSLALCAFDALRDLAHAYLYNEIESALSMQVTIDDVKSKQQ